MLPIDAGDLGVRSQQAPHHRPADTAGRTGHDRHSLNCLLLYEGLHLIFGLATSKAVDEFRFQHRCALVHRAERLGFSTEVHSHL